MKTPVAVMVVATLVLSACGELASTVTDGVETARETVQETVSGAVDTAQSVQERAQKVGEGIGEIRQGAAKVKGAFSGSGSTW